VLCTIQCKLDIPLSHLKTLKNSNGGKLKGMEHSVEMVPSDGSKQGKQGGQNAFNKFG
jgi:hypothetical protein